MTTRRTAGKAKRTQEESSSSTHRDDTEVNQAEEEHAPFNLAMPAGVDQLKAFASTLNGLVSFFEGFEQEKNRVNAIVTKQAEEIAELRESGKRAREEIDGLKENVRKLAKTSQEIAREAVEQYRLGVIEAMNTHQVEVGNVSDSRVIEAFKNVVVDLT